MEESSGPRSLTRRLAGNFDSGTDGISDIEMHAGFSRCPRAPIFRPTADRRSQSGGFHHAGLVIQLIGAPIRLRENGAMATRGDACLGRRRLTLGQTRHAFHETPVHRGLLLGPASQPRKTQYRKVRFS